MKRPEIATYADLVARLEQITASAGDDRSRGVLEALRASEGAGQEILRLMREAEGLDDEIGQGVLDKQALSSLPLMGILQLEESYQGLLRRVTLYEQAAKQVRLVVTPSFDAVAKLHLTARQPVCCLSIGLVVAVQCAALCLACRPDEFGPKTTLRDHLNRACGLRIQPSSTIRAYREDFRSADTHSFTEQTPLLEALGIAAVEVNALIRDAHLSDFVLASILANEALRFLVLHEIAHFAFGHPQLLRMWVDAPEDAARLLNAGFPDGDARRAMESAADAWAAEMLLISAVSPESSILIPGLFGQKATQLQKTHLIVAAIEFVFMLLGAIDTYQSGRSSMLQTMGDALSGEVRDMYPGAAARSRYAVPKALRRASVGYPEIRWVRWWRMRRELDAFDDSLWFQILWNVWQKVGLGGWLPVITKRQLKPAPVPFDTSLMRPRPPLQGKDAPLGIGFDYARAHISLRSDLNAAKAWWTAQLPMSS